MELIDQHTKKIMEGCKERARAAGLRFERETLEYIVTNRDLLELTPKMMIPTLYDYWVHDVEVVREKGRYELYPGNPYETVINTRPAVSFYNDNNPDWLNVMIFYHVLAHVDFFQNNLFFRHTWNYDFNGQALSDKRLIAKLRSEKGRWVDYVIEFARGIDNLVGFYDELSQQDRPRPTKAARRRDFYFDVFLQSVRKVKVAEYIREIERYNDCIKAGAALGEEVFFAEVVNKYPEFEALFQKDLEKESDRKIDLLQFLMKKSPILQKDENQWMKSVMQVVRNTALFFQPQLRTKIMNEGWASYWHEKLFLGDDRIGGHEVDYARTHAGVTALPRLGLNPYALGMRLYADIAKSAASGRYSIEYSLLTDVRQREQYRREGGNGKEFIFGVRKSLNDFLFIKTFVDQDFVSRHKLFVAGKRLNRPRGVWEYYVKSRNADDYRAMLLNGLYHPPFIEVLPEKNSDGVLYLCHRFEGKPLIKGFIANTMLGIEFLWGNPVRLETSEVQALPEEDRESGGIRWERVLYTMKNRKLSREVLSDETITEDR